MRLLNYCSEFLKEIQFRYRVGCFNIYKIFKKPVTVSTKQGVFTLPMEIDDSISRWLYTRRHYELDLISEAMNLIRGIKELPKGKGTLLDVGANNGVISIQMLVRGEWDKSIAIEPDPKNFASLKHNVKQNDLENSITCLNYAVSDTKGILQFELSEDNWGDHRVRKSLPGLQSDEQYDESKRRTINVEADTLGNLLANVDQTVCMDVALLWIDVQGHEGYVFAGGKELLSRGIPAVSELWPYGIQRSGMSQETFCGIVSEIWSYFWVKRRGKFVKYPIDVFYTFFDEIGYDGDYETVIFTS